jgi:hypothetical protein
VASAGAFLLESLELSPLVGTQCPADSQEHRRVLFLQPPARRGDQIDLRRHSRLVRTVRVQEWLQAELLLLQIRPQVNEPETMCKERLFDLTHLDLGQAELFRHLGILPPRARTRTHRLGGRR